MQCEKNDKFCISMIAWARAIDAYLALLREICGKLWAKIDEKLVVLPGHGTQGWATLVTRARGGPEATKAPGQIDEDLAVVRCRPRWIVSSISFCCRAPAIPKMSIEISREPQKLWLVTRFA